MTTSTDPPRLPFARRDLFDAPARYREPRADGPITRVRTQAGDLAWLVTGYAETRRLLADDRLGRAHPDPGRAARISNSGLVGGPRGDFATEKAANERMRRLLVPAFSRRRTNALREHIQARVELQTVFGTLFRRFPTLAPAVPVDRLRRLAQRLSGGLAELPVMWE